MGFMYPGRSMCRPSIRFNNAECADCNKKYPVSSKHSPGLLTVQCICANPKLIGLRVMTQAESVSMTLSSILTHFAVLPFSLVYENACNLLLSVLPRFPWMLKFMLPVVDRFHFVGHICNALHDAERFPFLDGLRTTGSESINARFKQAISQMSYLKGENFIPFLRVRCGMLNLSSLFRERISRADMEDEDLASFLRVIYDCPCTSCRAQAEESSSQTESRGSVDGMRVGGEVAEPEGNGLREVVPEGGTVSHGDLGLLRQPRRFCLHPAVVTPDFGSAGVVHRTRPRPHQQTQSVWHLPRNHRVMKQMKVAGGILCGV